MAAFPILCLSSSTVILKSSPRSLKQLDGCMPRWSAPHLTAVTPSHRVIDFFLVARDLAGAGATLRFLYKCAAAHARGALRSCQQHQTCYVHRSLSQNGSVRFQHGCCWAWPNTHVCLEKKMSVWWLGWNRHGTRIRPGARHMQREATVRHEK